MKSRITLFLLVLCSTIGISQTNYNWHYAIGGFGSDGTQDVYYDVNDNVYAAGFHQGFTFNATAVTDTLGDTTTLSIFGAKDAFATKFNANGSVAWTKALGGPGAPSSTNIEEALAIAVDDTGNVYVGGHFNGASFTIGSTTTNGNGTSDEDAFLVKLNSNGHVTWAKAYGFDGDQRITDLAIDHNGNVIVVGMVGDSISLGSFNILGSGNLFVASLLPDGSLNWQRHTTSGNATSVLSEVDIDSDGNIYVGGEINGSGISGSGSHFGGYIAKLKDNGHVIWEKSIAGGDNRIEAISVSGKLLYTSGNHSATLNLTSSISFGVAGSSDGFVAEYDTAGNFINAMHLTSSSGDEVSGIFAPNDVDVFFTGTFNAFQVEAKDTSGSIMNDFFQIGNSDFYIIQSTDTLHSAMASVYGNSGTNFDKSSCLAGNSNTVAIGGEFNGSPFYMKNQSSGPSVTGNAGTAFVGQFGFTPTISTPPGPTPTPTYKVKFTVDMANEVVDPAGVFLSFLDSNHVLKDTAMINATSKIYSLELLLDSGTIVQYRYKNGTSTFESVPYQCNVVDSNGNFSREWTFIQNDSIPMHCWAACDTCPPPPPPCPVGSSGNISGPASYCMGDQEIEFSINPVVGATSYVWYFDGTAQTIAAGQGSSKVKLNITESLPTTLRVYGTNGICNGDTATLNLNTPSLAVNFDINIDQQPKCGYATGALSIGNLSGGSTYDFAWTNGETTQSIDTLSGGLYEVTVTSDQGCFKVDQVKLVSNSAPSLSFNVTHPNCHGDLGIIDMTINGGTGPFDIKWLRGDVTEDISNVSGGGYFVEVKDDSNCVVFECVSVVEPDPIKVTFTNMDPTTCTSNDGQIMLTPEGGNGSFNYSWNNGGNSDTESNLSGGIYVVTVTDMNNCSTEKSIGLTEMNGLELKVDSVFGSECANDIGKIYTSIGNAANPIILWNTGDTLEDLTGLNNGEYAVQVDDSNCTAAVVVNVEERKPLPVDLCMVTVDDTTGNNLLVFDKTNAESSVTSFNIYRESCNPDEFLLIGNVLSTEQSEFEDVNSDPKIKSWKYKISTVDNCGNESYQSAFHKTIHSVTTGDTTRAEIKWNDYIGFSYDWFFVERFTSATGWVLMDSVQSNVHDYLDNAPIGTANDLFYSVYVKHPFGCTSYDGNKNYNSARSNRTGPPPPPNLPNDTTADTTDTTISIVPILSFENVMVYPNPLKEEVNMVISGKTEQTGTIRILGLRGEVLQQMFISISSGDNYYQFNLKDYAKGPYFIELSTDQGILRKIILKE